VNQAPPTGSAPMTPSTPGVHAEGGLAERLARLVETTPATAMPPEPDPVATHATELADATVRLAEAVERADTETRDRDQALAAGVLDLRELLGATRAAVGTLSGELGEQLDAGAAEAGSRMDGVADQVHAATDGLAAELVRSREALDAAQEELAALRGQVTELARSMAALEGVESRLESRLGARIDEAIFALAQTVLAAAR